MTSQTINVHHYRHGRGGAGIFAFMGAVIALFWPLGAFHGGWAWVAEAVWLSWLVVVWAAIFFAVDAAKERAERERLDKQERSIGRHRATGNYTLI